MDALTVVLAPAGPARGVLDALTDWSGADLVRDFLWVQTRSLPEGGVPALLVTGGRLRGTTVAEALAATRYERVRIAVLVPVLSGALTATLEEEAQLAEVVARSGAGAAVVRMRLLLVRPAQRAPRSDLARAGWHNVVVSPEDAAGPGRGHVLLPATLDPVELGRAAVPTVVSLTGLWRDVDHAPLDHVAPAPGEVLLLARSFYRRLSARAVEHELRTRIASTAEGYPRPRQHGGRAVHIEDTALASATMAGALWTAHAGVLRGPRVTSAVETPKPLGALAALAMLWSFLGAALRNAPAQWAAATVRRVNSEVAGAVHGVVFGSAPAAYEVVVNGTTAAGVPVGWRDLALASMQLDDALAQQGPAPAHEGHADLSALWRDYAAGAMTLMDSGERVSWLPPVQVGADAGVLRDAGSCVPAPSQTFDEVPGHLAGRVGGAPIEAVDVLAAHTLGQKLRGSAADPSLALEADRCAGRLAQWTNRHRTSYAVCVGTTLGSALMNTAAEVQGLLRTLADAGSAQGGEATAGVRQRRLGRTLLLMLGIAALVEVVVIVLTATGSLSTTAGIVLVVVVLLVWVVASLMVFLRGQRELFRDLNRRREAASHAEATRTNLRHAVKDLRRLTDAYAQYLSWSRVLGVLLSTPFGSAAPEEERVVALGRGLPRAVDIGVAEPDGPALTAAARQIRRHLFSAGWLADPWRAFLDEAPSVIGPDAPDLLEEPDDLFTELGAGSGSLLDRWSARLVTEGPGARSGLALWGAVLAQLHEGDQGAQEPLLASVRSVRPFAPVVGRAEFMTGIDGPASPQGAFDDSVLATAAKAAGRYTVASSVPDVRSVGLGQVAVLTQVGELLPVYDFDLAEDAQERSIPRSGLVF